MASADRIILAYAGEPTFALLRLRGLLEVWGIDYILRRPDDAAIDVTAPGRQDALSSPPDRTLLIRAWTWPYVASVFPQELTRSFVEQRVAHDANATPAIIDILLDHRYAGRSPESGATRTLDASAQPWLSWTTNLRAALHVGRRLKDEAAILAHLFSPETASAYAAEQAAAELSLQAAQRHPGAASPLTRDALIGRVVGGYQIDAMVGDDDGVSPYVTYHGVRATPSPAYAEIAIALRASAARPSSANQLRERFTAAAQRRRTFQHSAIAAVAEIGETDEYFYAVVPYPAGATLAETLAAAPNAPLSLSTIARYLTQLADAVDSAADAGIILRDLSLENILMDSQGRPLIASVGYPDSSVATRVDCVNAMGSVAYALVTSQPLAWMAPGEESPEQPLGALNADMWRRRLILPAPSEAAILGALRPSPAFSSCAAFARAFRSGLMDLWTESMTPAHAAKWSTWWRTSYSGRPGVTLHRRLTRARIVAGALAVLMILVIAVVILAVLATPPGTGPTGNQTSHGASGGSSGGGAAGGPQQGLVGVMSFANVPPAPPLPTIANGTMPPIAYTRPTATSLAFVSPTHTASTNGPTPGPTSTLSPAPGPTGTANPTPGPTATFTPGPTATPSMSCLAAGTSNTDTFSDSKYTIGSTPIGYVLSGAPQAAPSIQVVRGYGQVLLFPYIFNQYWGSWAVDYNGGQALCGLYTVTTKYTFLTSVSDRAGIIIAWHYPNGGHIEIQPNIYHKDIEYWTTGLGGTFTPLYGSSLPISAGVPYWLRVVVTNNAPGASAATVLWSTDGNNFIPVGKITGVSDLDGLAGMSTAGPNMPETAYSFFQYTAG